MINIINESRTSEITDWVCKIYLDDIKSRLQARICEKEFSTGKGEKKTTPFFSGETLAEAVGKYLSDNVDRIITCRPRDFSLLKEEIDIKLLGFCKGYDGRPKGVHRRKMRQYAVREEIKRKIEYVFDYNYFSGFVDAKGEKVYFKMVQKLKIPTCPYCNRAYISFLDSAESDKKLRPPLDHFLPKSKYPMFSLSFYNLIPCCWFCNTVLKGAVDFDQKNFISPYEANTNISHGFSFKYKMIKIGDRIGYTTGIEYQNETSDDRIKRTLNVFAVEELYRENHNDLAEELRTKYFEDNEEYRRYLFELIRECMPTREEFYRFYFGSYYEVADFEKRPLSKFTHDLVKDLGILKEAGFSEG